MHQSLAGPPRVTVVMPCYNHARYLPEAVASVQAQTLPDWEAIMVNDGSLDDTAEVADRLAAGDARIRVLHQPNQGPGPSRNRAITLARGDYILPLDADDLLDAGMLAATVPVLDEHPEVGFVYTDVRMVGEEQSIWSGGPFDPALLAHDCRLVSCSLFRRSAWASSPGFRAIPYEDWDFWLSLVERGWAGWHVPRVLVQYRRHASGRFERHRRRTDMAQRAQIICNHPGLYPPPVVSWAAGVLSHPAPSRLRGLAAFGAYAVLIGRYQPRLLPKTLLRPLFVRLTPHQQGIARRAARWLRITAGAVP